MYSNKGNLNIGTNLFNSKYDSFKVYYIKVGHTY